MRMRFSRLRLETALPWWVSGYSLWRRRRSIKASPVPVCIPSSLGATLALLCDVLFNLEKQPFFLPFLAVAFWQQGQTVQSCRTGGRLLVTSAS